MIECKGYKEFAQYIIDNLTNDSKIKFATCRDYDDDTENDNWRNYSSWYFVKLMQVNCYGSRFILIDYCGGEEAFVIPLSNCGGFDGKLFDGFVDEEMIKAFSRRFFNECISLGKETYSVWIENERED